MTEISNQREDQTGIAILAVVMLLLAGCGIVVPPPTPNGPPAELGLATAVDEVVLTTMVARRLPGIAVGIARADSMLYARGYGWTDLEERRSATENSLFHTASVSKLFTARAILRLVEGGQIELEDRLVDLLPELNYVDERFASVSVRQLLNHTAGLPDIRNYRWHRNHSDPASLGRYLRGEQWQLETAPGVSFSYSNLGYDLLGYLVEVTAGMPFERYLKDSVLLSSGMTQSDFRYFILPDSLKVTPYTETSLFGGIRPRGVYPYTREHTPSSTLNASSRELAEWMANFLGELRREDSTGLHRRMIQPATDLTDNVGLGFQRYVIDGQTAVGHFGGDRGFRSFLVMFPEMDLGVVVLGNCDFAEDFRQEIARGILGVFLEED